MKLTKKQKDFLLKIYPFFLSLEPKEVNQGKGSGDAESGQCGKCFGWWLAYLYNIITCVFSCSKGFYDFDDGINLFNREMGLQFSLDICNKVPFKNKKTMEFAEFMNSCGSVDHREDFLKHPFDGHYWNLQPHEVIRNMLERGA